MSSQTLRPEAVSRVGSLGVWVRAIRPEQWLKNGFVLSPIVFSGRALIWEYQWRALVAFASSTRIAVAIPPDVEPGPAPIRIEDLPGATAYVTVGGAWATGLHQVDNPVFDADGNLFVTYSGSRGQESPVSIFRVTRAGTREPFVSGIVNATSMAIGPDG